MFSPEFSGRRRPDLVREQIGVRDNELRGAAEEILRAVQNSPALREAIAPIALDAASIPTVSTEMSEAA